MIFRPFEEDKDERENYKGQLKHYFAGHNIIRDLEDKELLLSWVGPTTYQLFGGINIWDNLEYKTHVIAASYKFKYATANGQTYNKWLVQVRDKARHCKYFDQRINCERLAIDEEIRDHVIMNMSHDHIWNYFLQMKQHHFGDILLVSCL
ncbi:hypothetical protein GJ496_008326 [Pomphorhynchus laevis]|nr:hypothetical protein GJ496_008326 [Pomphorhynchus laevis]